VVGGGGGGGNGSGGLPSDSRRQLSATQPIGGAGGTLPTASNLAPGLSPSPEWQGREDVVLCVMVGMVSIPEPQL